jgi:hypothetical protein
LPFSAWFMPDSPSLSISSFDSRFSLAIGF